MSFRFNVSLGLCVFDNFIYIKELTIFLEIIYIFRRVTKAFTNNCTMQCCQCTIIFIELMEVRSSFTCFVPHCCLFSLRKSFFYVRLGGREKSLVEWKLGFFKLFCVASVDYQHLRLLEQ